MKDRITRRPSQTETSFKRKIVRPILVTAASAAGLLLVACVPTSINVKNSTINGLGTPSPVAGEPTPLPREAGPTPTPAPKT